MVPITIALARQTSSSFSRKPASLAAADLLAHSSYSGLNVLALILSFFFVPGTQRVTLEEMDWICRSLPVATLAPSAHTIQLGRKQATT